MTNAQQEPNPMPGERFMMAGSIFFMLSVVMWLLGGDSRSLSSLPFSAFLILLGLSQVTTMLTPGSWDAVLRANPTGWALLPKFLRDRAFGWLIGAMCVLTGATGIVTRLV